jgi:hypothetical protein
MTNMKTQKVEMRTIGNITSSGISWTTNVQGCSWL